MRICLTADETKELSSMSNLSEGVMEEGIRIGRKEGREINTVLKLRTPETLMRQGFIRFSDIRQHHIMHTVWECKMKCVSYR